MKLKIFLLFIVFSDLLMAQVWHDKSQTFLLGVGDGFVHKNRVVENKKIYTSKSTASYGSIRIWDSPALFIKFERAINKYIGIGMVFGYRKTEITQTIPYTYYDTSVKYPSPFGGYYYMSKTANDIFTFKVHDVNIGARINYHPLPDKKIDPYIGVAIGYRLFNRDYIYTTDNPHGVYYVVEYENVLPIYSAATIGVKYLFTNEIGVYAELGIDKWSVIQGGVVFKIK